MTVAIVGSRSWLSPHFTDELVRRGHSVVHVAKGDVPYENFSKFSAVILIAGRARPTDEEILREEALVADACKNPHQPRRWIYVSSGAVDRWERGSRPLSRAGEAYVLAKKRCETAICGRPSGMRKGDGYAIRLPVIFGEGQSLDSDMLVPSVARARITRRPLEVRQPLLPFELVHASDAARATCDLLEEHDPLPIRSVRSDLHVPMRLVSVMAPGLPMVVGEGWQYHEKGYPEKGQRHLTEQHFNLRDADLVRTMEWYDRFDRIQFEKVGEQLSLPEGSSIIDV